MHYGIPFGFAMAVASTTVHAEEFGGIEFPGGIASFADQVVSYDPNFSGGPAPSSNTDPATALGVPNPDFVSLGRGGALILRFTDNVLTGSGDDSPDLHIFEIGPDVEDTFVAVSPDGQTWTEVGKVLGSTSSIDIDAFGLGLNDQFSYVRLIDDPDEGGSSGSTVGADIDAVGAISSQPVENCGGVWFDPTRSGTGVTLFEEGSIVSGTFYLYDSTGNDMWLTFIGERQGNTMSAQLLRFTGPALGSNYDPALVTGTAVGTVQMTFVGGDAITVQYSVEGVAGTLNLVPFSVVNP